MYNTNIIASKTRLFRSILLLSSLFNEKKSEGRVPLIPINERYLYITQYQKWLVFWESC